jgi:predicted esterase
MMNYTSYEVLDREVDKLFAQKNFDEALERLAYALQHFPERKVDTEIYQAAIFCQLERYEDAFAIFRASVKQGTTYPLQWAMFDPLKKLEGYVEVEAENRRLFSLEKENAKSEYKIFLPEGYSEKNTYPLFIALHGDGGGGNISQFSANWRPEYTTQHGYITAYIQSSQFYYTENHGWLKDPHTARRDVEAGYREICKQYPIDTRCTIIGGFSGGAITSIDVTFANIIPVKGFIALCPGRKPEGFTKENVEQATRRGVRGVFMEGDLETMPPEEQTMIEIAQQADSPYQFYVNSGSGHWIPDGLPEKIDQALAHITKTG